MKKGIRQVAIIPARGNSQRLPRKNIIQFLGKPLIAYSIDAAIKSCLFERIVVSTEDAEIANICLKLGAEIDKRNPVLATDNATVTEVCLDFLCREEREGRCYDVLCVLYATAPMRTADDIIKVMSLIELGVCDFGIAVTDYGLPPHQALKLKAGNWVEPMWPDLITCRSDNIGPLCVDNGSTYAASVPAFRKEKSLYGSPMRTHQMPRSRSIDIDTRNDLDLAVYFAEKNVQ